MSACSVCSGGGLTAAVWEIDEMPPAGGTCWAERAGGLFCSTCGGGTIVCSRSTTLFSKSLVGATNRVTEKTVTITSRGGASLTFVQVLWRPSISRWLCFILRKSCLCVTWGRGGLLRICPQGFGGQHLSLSPRYSCWRGLTLIVAVSCCSRCRFMLAWCTGVLLLLPWLGVGLWRHKADREETISDTVAAAACGATCLILIVHWCCLTFSWVTSKRRLINRFILLARFY